MKKIIFLINIIFLITALFGCNSSTPVVNKIAASTAVSKADYLPTPISEITATPTPKDFSNERISEPFSKELHGVVYKGYLLDYSRALGAYYGDYSVYNICNSLDIKVTPSYDGLSKELLTDKRDIWSPPAIILEKGKVRLIFKLSHSYKDSFNYQGFPGVPYKAYKNGQEVSFKSINEYKGNIYISSLEELLSAMEIQYYLDAPKGIIYIDSDKATEIKGRILENYLNGLSPGEKSRIKLIYNFRTSTEFEYREIILQINGKRAMEVTVFDKYYPGRSLYYANGNVSIHKIKGDTLIQVKLSDTPANGNIDSAIYKYTQDTLMPIFSIAQYEDYFTGGINLESNNSGICSFEDPARDIKKTLDLKVEKINTQFRVDVRDVTFELRPSSTEEQLTIRASSILKNEFFNEFVFYDYKKGYFEPKEILLTNNAYYQDEASLLYKYSLDNGQQTPDYLGESVEIKYEKRFKLRKMTFVNLNDLKNSKISLKLPKGWYVNEYMRDTAPSFEFDAPKNKKIKKVYDFELFNKSIRYDRYQFGNEVIAGSFAMLGYYRDEPPNTIFPNHTGVNAKVYSGNTTLGKGEIFILDRDLEKNRRREGENTYNEIYAWIPIDNEREAYNLTLDVPLGESPEDYVEIVKEILGVN